MQSDLPPTQSLSSPSILHLHPMALLHTSPEEQLVLLYFALAVDAHACTLQKKDFWKKKKKKSMSFPGIEPVTC